MRPGHVTIVWIEMSLLFSDEVCYNSEQNVGKIPFLIWQTFSFTISVCIKNPLTVRLWLEYATRGHRRYSKRSRFLSVATMQPVIGFNFDLVMIGRFAANISISFVTFNRSERATTRWKLAGSLKKEVESFFQVAGLTGKSDERRITFRLTRQLWVRMCSKKNSL